MFLEVCIISMGLYVTGELCQKVRKKIDELKDEIHETDTSDYQNAQSVKVKFQKLVLDTIDPLVGTTREKQLKEISAPQKLSEDEKAINLRMGVASVTLGVGVMSQLIYPPMIIATIPATFWVSSIYLKDAFHALFREHRISVDILDVVLFTLGILCGYIFAQLLGSFLIILMRKLLQKTKDNSRKKLINVFDLYGSTVWIKVDDAEIEIPFEHLQISDLVVVNTGEIIPVDGDIINGTALVDQRTLTGESQPAEKGVGDQVFASTVVLSGKICVQAERAGRETVAANIGEMLSRTMEYKTSFESKTERFVDRSVLPTLGLSTLALPTVGASGAMAILLSSVGYNMRLLAPLTTLTFLNLMSRRNILIKEGSALEGLTQVNTILFDKTGTLTLEQPRVGNIYSCNGLSEDVLLAYAAAAQNRQNHPVARAILSAAEELNLTLPETEEGQYEIGYGITVFLDNQEVKIGSGRLMKNQGIDIPDEIKSVQKDCDFQGYSLVMVAVGGELAGAIEICTAIRPEARELVLQLKKRGISTYIISGDTEAPTRTLAQELGIEHYFAGTLPEHKAEIVEQLKQEGRTICFVGDGINDSIALKKADVSVSLHGASTVAIDTAQVVLMDKNLLHLVHLLDIAKHFKVNQKKNIIISTAPCIVCIGGVFLLHWGIYASMLMYFGSLGIGAYNSIRPATNRKFLDGIYEPENTI